MIENYLDFVKAERKRLLLDSKLYYQKSKLDQAEWSKGYFQGSATAQLIASWRWKRLQKDIEARILGGGCLAIALGAFPDVEAILS